MTKKLSFIDSPEWSAIVQNISGILTSDGIISVLMDFERVLDTAHLYAFENWKTGELVDGPVIGRYSVAATFMYPRKLMPDPRGGKRLLALGCEVKFKKTTIQVPIEIKRPDDYLPGTHAQKMIEQHVWLVNISMPRDLISSIREGKVNLADQEIDLEDLDKAYEQDYDKDRNKKPQDSADQLGGMPGLGGMPDMTGGLGAPGGMPI